MRLASFADVDSNHLADALRELADSVDPETGSIEPPVYSVEATQRVNTPEDSTAELSVTYAITDGCVHLPFGVRHEFSESCTCGPDEACDNCGGA